MSTSGRQVGEADSLEKLAAVALINPDAARALLPFAVRDPVGTARVRKHHEAHGQLDRLAAIDVSRLTPRRAHNRLRKVRRLYAFLNRTADVHADVPCRDDRERRIGPIMDALTAAARGRIPKRPKETPPMLNSHPLARGGAGVGRIVEGPRENDSPARPAATAEPRGASLADLPPVLRPMLTAFERQFTVQVFASIRADHAVRLARMLLDLPPAERQDTLARVLFRLAMRSAR
jgi:hypothetical protein